MTDLVPAPVPSPGVAWPTTPRAFADTTLCPRCFAVLPSSLCDSCGLDLGVPLAAELIQASNSLVETEQRRRELIERMWREQLSAQATAYARTVSAIPAQQTVKTPAVPQHAPAFIPDAAGAAAAPPLEPAASVRATPPTGPRRSGVQVFLLVSGIVLLSVFALFFLTVAYLFATVELRVIVTGLAGLVVFGVAGVLQRRRLPATAEGVGVAGAAILIGTLGFVRGAELFGSATISPAVFSGLGFLVLAALLAGIHRLTSLHFARIGCLLLVPTAVALIVIGALDPVDGGLAWWLGLLAAGASTLLVRHTADRSAEVVLVRSIAFGSTTAALVPAALLLPDVPGMSAVAYLVCTLTWAAFVLRLDRQSGVGAWTSTASALLGLSIVLAPAVAILRAASTEWNLWLPGTAASAVVAVLVVLAHRTSSSSMKHTLSWARWPALVVAAAGLLPGVGFALVHVLGSLVPRYSLWQANPDDPSGMIVDAGAWASVLAPAGAAVLGAVVIRLVPLPIAARAVVGGLAGLALLAAASHGGTVVTVLLGYLLVAIAGLAALLFARRRGAPDVQTPAAAALGVATLALIVLSHASPLLWLPTVLAAVCLVVATRYAIVSDGSAQRAVRAVLTAAAAALTFAEASLIVPWLSGLGTGAFVVDFFSARPLEFVGVPGVTAALLLCVTPFMVRPGVDRVAPGAADLRAASIVALPVVIIGCVVAVATPATSTIEYVVRIAIPVLVAVAGLLWQRRAPVAGFVERVVLASAAPLAISAALAAVADAIDRPSGVLGEYLAGPVAAITAASVGVLIFARASTGFPGAARIAWQSSISVAIVVAAARAAADAGGDTWIVLALLAVAPLIIACSSGNPFTSAAPRRYFDVPSCILAVAALWQFLVFRGETQVEPYSLPVAGLLLCIAAAIAMFGSRSTPAVAGRSTLFAAGLAVAFGPSSIASIVGPTERGVVLLVLAAFLAAAALVASRVVRGILVRDTALIVSLIVLVVVGGAGTLRDAVGGVALVPEVWILPAALALVGTSIVWTRRRAVPFRIAQLGVPAAVALVGLGTTFCLAVLPETFAPVRLLVSSAALAAVSVGAALSRRVPLDRVSQYTSNSLLVVIGIAGLATSSAQPFELSTVPLALTLIVSGIVALRRDPAARSWPHLGPGLAALLVPSLLADFGDTALWRVIALGVLSVAVVVAAIALRWQAPLVVGASVLIVHALAQSWPWIQGLYSAVPWWIWLGVGGIVLIAVAARYEHRVRNLRSFVGSIAALR